MLTIDMVIDALKNNPVGHFPRQALEDAITQQAAITPMQLQYLAETAAAPLPPPSATTLAVTPCICGSGLKYKRCCGK